MKRIGHKGAHLIEAGNTIASFETARGLDVDMIEFDVLRWNGELVVAHDLEDAAEREGHTLLTLEQSLEYLSGSDFSEIGLDVDMKHRGFELEVVDQLARFGLRGRTTITTMYEQSLALIREHDPGLHIGLTIPLVTRDWLAVPSPVKPLVAAGAGYHRVRQPARVGRLVRSGAIDAVMAFHALVGRRLVDTVQSAGGEIYVWTVDDAATILRLEALGVDGIVSNDPRLFEHLAAAEAAAA
ncbi:MAG: glycerophosphodiester phosphodiesterase [Actinobacteria bacterium]|nr:glycerophosphodiester phosphodiesterase [Actinomycetota bacterium]